MKNQVEYRPYVTLNLEFIQNDHKLAQKWKKKVIAQLSNQNQTLNQSSTKYFSLDLRVFWCLLWITKLVISWIQPFYDDLIRSWRQVILFILIITWWNIIMKFKFSLNKQTLLLDLVTQYQPSNQVKLITWVDQTPYRYNKIEHKKLCLIFQKGNESIISNFHHWIINSINFMHHTSRS